MKKQSLQLVKDNDQLIPWREVGKSKKRIFHLFTVLTMLLLFSCSKNMDTLPGQGEIAVSSSSQSSAAEVSSYQELVPYERTLFVPCGNGGAGEDVTMTGSLKFVEQIIYNDRGFTFNYHIISQGVTGIGLSTGETFQVSGGNKGTITGEYGEYGQYTRVFMVQLRIIGQHSVFSVVYKFKVTITPDGGITTTIEEDNVDCRL